MLTKAQPVEEMVCNLEFEFLLSICACILSHIKPFATPWTLAHQVPLSMGFFQARILEWVAISFSKDLPDPGINLTDPDLQDCWHVNKTAYVTC